MDWTKSKTILIVALLIADLVLILFMYDAYRPDENQQEILKNTIAYMKDRGFTVSGKIPDEEKKMSYLSVKYETVNQDLLKQALDNQTPLESASPSKEEVLALCDSVIRAAGMFSDSMAEDKIVKSDVGWIVTYKTMVDGIPLEKSDIRCEVQNGRVTSVLNEWLEPTGFGSAKKDILPLAEALMNFTFAIDDSYANVDLDSSGSIPAGGAASGKANAPGNGSIPAGGIPGKGSISNLETSPANHKDHIDITDMQVVYWLNPDAFHWLNPDETDTVQPLAENTAYPAWKITYQVNGGSSQVKYIDALGN